MKARGPGNQQVITSSVLVLNQNYQPLNVCNVRRAVSLLGRGRAETLEQSGSYLHSAYALLAEPAVIRLDYLVKRPLHRRRLSRREVFARDHYQCQYCGVHTRALTLDHVIPRSRGGLHAWSNVVSACDACNHRKAGRTPREAEMKLLRKPREPRPNPYALFHNGSVMDSWRPFLPWMEPVGPDARHAAAAAG